MMRIQSMLPWVLARKLRATVARCDALENENRHLIGRLTEASSRVDMPDDSSNIVGMLAEASSRGLELVAQNSELASENHHMRAEIGALTALARSLQWRIVRFERAAGQQKEDLAQLEKAHDNAFQRLALAEYRNVKLGEDLDRVERRAAALTEYIARLDSETLASEGTRRVVEDRVSEIVLEEGDMLHDLSPLRSPAAGRQGAGSSRTPRPLRETTPLRSSLP